MFQIPFEFYSNSILCNALSSHEKIENLHHGNVKCVNYLWLSPSVKQLSFYCH